MPCAASIRVMAASDAERIASSRCKTELPSWDALACATHALAVACFMMSASTLGLRTLAIDQA